MRTIRTFLLLLTMVAAVPPVLFAAFVLVRLADSQVAASGRDTIELARAINVAIDERVGEQIAALQTLAGSASMQAGDMAAFRVELDAASRLLQSPVSLCDLQGQELMNTRLAPGERLPVRAGAPFAAEAARTGRPVVSNLYKGAISGRWIATIEVPVTAEGAARYVLAMSIEPPTVNALIRRQLLPPELMVSVIDRNGVFFTRSRDGEARTGTPASDTFVHRSAAAPEGWTRTISVEGSRNYLAFSRSELTGWSVGIGVPVGIVMAPLRQALVPLAVAGIGLVAASLLLATLIARRIQRPVAALTRLASGASGELGPREFGEKPAPGLRETDEVARALLATRAHEREAAARLQASEARYRALAEAQPSVMFVADAQGGCTYVNRAFQELTGLAAPALLGRGWMDALHPDDRGRTEAAWRDSVRTLAPYEVECRFRRADGSHRCFLMRGAPALGPGGEATAWFGTATDITDLVAARETLARQGDALEAEVAARTAERDRTWKLSRDMLAVTDSRGRFVSINPAFTEQLGHPEEAFIRARYIDFVHPDDRPHTTSQQIRARDGESLDGLENRMRCADGSWRVLSWTTRTQDGLTYCAARDVTQQRATEAALRAAEEQARQTQKLEAIGQLTGGLAHDFNNLLQVVSTNLELMAAGSPGAQASFDRRHAAAADAVRRGAALTRQLLAFARKQPLEPRVLDPGRLLHDQAELLRRTLGETIEVTATGEPGVWNVSADPNQLENAILNLAVNARDAIMSRGPQSAGRVTLEARNAVIDARYAAAHPGVEPGEYVCVAVSDTGPGMAPEVAARAFEPFFTTKRDGEGTGLGLAQVYGFAKQSGGHAAIYAEPGLGAVVRLYLARASQPAPWAGAAPAAAAEAAGGDETVLVVEDDAEVQAAAVEMLESLGYRTLRASDGASGLAAFEVGVAIDLVFTDVVMPGPVSSGEMAHRAREMHPGVAVLFTSGYTESGAAHHGRLEPGVALLTKPYGRVELARKVRSLLDAPCRPLPEPEPSQRERLSAGPAGRPRVRPRMILLVEDDELVRISAAMLLESMGHGVVEAGTGAQALAMLRSEPAIDVLMTDLGLPDINGADVVGRAREMRPALMVIVATGRAASDEADGAVTLQKPYDLRQMAAALARAEALAAERAA